MKKIFLTLSFFLAWASPKSSFFDKTNSDVEFRMVRPFDIGLVGNKVDSLYSNYSSITNWHRCNVISYNTNTKILPIEYFSLFGIKGHVFYSNVFETIFRDMSGDFSNASARELFKEQLSENDSWISSNVIYINTNIGSVSFCLYVSMKKVNEFKVNSLNSIK